MYKSTFVLILSNCSSVFIRSRHIYRKSNQLAKSLKAIPYVTNPDNLSVLQRVGLNYKRNSLLCSVTRGPYCKKREESYDISLLYSQRSLDTNEVKQKDKNNGLKVGVGFSF